MDLFLKKFSIPRHLDGLVTPNRLAGIYIGRVGNVLECAISTACCFFDKTAGHCLNGSATRRRPHCLGPGCIFYHQNPDVQLDRLERYLSIAIPDIGARTLNDIKENDIWIMAGMDDDDQLIEADRMDYQNMDIARPPQLIYAKYVDVDSGDWNERIGGMYYIRYRMTSLHREFLASYIKRHIQRR